MTPRIWKLILAVLLFVAAFGVRYYQWEREGINPDEPAWQTRIENFTSAISKREWQYTQQSLHPGVTLSWLASIGRSVAGYNAPGTFVYPFTDPSIFWSVHWAEVLMIILTTALCISLIFFLLVKLVTIPAAFFGALLVALDPFFISNSRIIQMDALLASFMVVSFLAALVFTKTSSRRYLMLSGLFAGLSLLTKINGAVILPAVGLILVGRYGLPRRPLQFGKLRNLFLELVGFGVVAVAVFVVLYPAMWVQPVLTIKNLIYGITSRGLTEGGESMGDVFFWGRVWDNPGPLFYPVVILFRTTPLVLLGAILSLLTLLKKTENRKLVVCFLLFVFLILLEMTVVAKKSERYILPIFLMLDVLAGVNLVKLTEFRGRFMRHKCRQYILTLIVLGQFVWLVGPLSWHYGSYYNPLVGGAQAAVQTITVGFGEGHTEIAEYINQAQARSSKPLWVSVFYGDAVRPLVNVGDIWYPSHWNRGDRDADLVIFYINQIQRQKDYSLWQEYKNKTPLKTVKINEIPYAYIFKGPAITKI